VHQQFEEKLELQQEAAAQEGLGPSLEDLRTERSRDERFAAAQQAFKEARYEAALDSFKQLRIEDPSRPEYWLREMASLVSLSRRQEARRLATELVGEMPALQSLPFVSRLLAETEAGSP
jgi:hypothetical protein